ADGQPPPTTDPVPSFRAEWEADEQAERDRRAAELRTFVAMTRMAGLSVPAALAPFENPAGDIDPEPARRAELAAAVRHTWARAPRSGRRGEADNRGGGARGGAELGPFVAMPGRAGLPAPAALAPFETPGGDIAPEPARRAELAAAVRQTWAGPADPMQLDRL